MGVLKKKNNPPKTLDLNILADFIIEEYRFFKSYTAMINKLYLEERQKYKATAEFHINKIIELATKANVAIQSFEGKTYDDGLPVTPLNLEEFTADDILVIDQTIEPAIINMDDGKAIRFGSVILSKQI